MAQRFNWRCSIWLPADGREAKVALAMFVIFLLLVPFGVKVGLPKTDLSFSGVDYKPVAAIVLTILLMAGCLLRTYFLAVGDYLCDARLLRVTLATWAALSVVALASSVVMATVPILSPLEPPDFFNKAVALALASQLTLASTLSASFIFKPSTSGASEVRASRLGARKTLAALWQRRQPGRHKEKQADTADWDRLLAFLEAIGTGGKSLPVKLKCPAEADYAGRLVANAQRFSAEINSPILHLRNIVLDADPGGANTAARDFFLLKEKDC